MKAAIGSSQDKVSYIFEYTLYKEGDCSTSLSKLLGIKFKDIDQFSDSFILLSPANEMQLPIDAKNNDMYCNIINSSDHDYFLTF